MNSPYASILLIAVLVLLMYFVVLRPQRKRQQAQAETMKTLEPGTRVMLTSGIYASIVSVGERQIVLETSPGVELTVLKQAVAKVVPEGEEDGSHDALAADLDDADEIDDADDFDRAGGGSVQGATFDQDHDQGYDQNYGQAGDDRRQSSTYEQARTEGTTGSTAPTGSSTYEQARSEGTSASTAASTGSGTADDGLRNPYEESTAPSWPPAGHESGSPSGDGSSGYQRPSDTPTSRD